jgi:hypothetical protein
MEKLKIPFPSQESLRAGDLVMGEVLQCRDRVYTFSQINEVGERGFRSSNIPYFEGEIHPIGGGLFQEYKYFIESGCKTVFLRASDNGKLKVVAGSRAFIEKSRGFLEISLEEYQKTSRAIEEDMKRGY